MLMAFPSFGLPGFYFIDRAGRRPLLLWLYPHLAWTTLAAAMSYYIPSTDSAHAIVIIMWGFLFVAFYSPGQGQSQRNLNRRQALLPLPASYPLRLHSSRLD
jgi:Sugar (and other) transporter